MDVDHLANEERLRLPNRDSTCAHTIRATGAIQLLLGAPTITSVPLGASTRRSAIALRAAGAELPVDDLPYLVEHVHQHMREREVGDQGAFAFGLDLILDGLERLRPVP